MGKPVIHVDAPDRFPMAPEGGSETFGANISPVGEALGLTKLGLTVIEVAPGKRGFPFHNHLANEEAFIILDGTGTYRFGTEEHPVKAGDICGAPRGGAETAHQIINTGDSTLKYIGISTRNDPEIVEYPDSGKFSAMAIWPGSSFFDAHLKIVARPEDARDYWEGEET